MPEPSAEHGAHDTYAEHCRERVPGTPAHGGGRCATCDATAPLKPPALIPIPDVTCANCGAGLAWRAGVGRYVISHANGDDVCSRASVRLAQEDREAANRAYRKADAEYAAALRTSPGASDG